MRRRNGLSCEILKRNASGNWRGFACLATHENIQYSHGREYESNEDESWRRNGGKSRISGGSYQSLTVGNPEEAHSLVQSFPGCTTVVGELGIKASRQHRERSLLEFSVSGESAGARCSNPWPDHIRPTEVLDLDHNECMDTTASSFCPAYPTDLEIPT